MSDLSILQKRLGYTHKPQRLRQALTHKSYLNESKEKGIEDNERLEFLGDAVLDLIISEVLVERFPNAPEGDLSKMKARVVSEATLARVAREIDLGQFLLLGKGEERTQGREKSSLLADAMEAVIAAVYLDLGFPAAREVILKAFTLPMEELTGPEVIVDYKTDLQEFCQREFETLPVYRVVQESGPDHQKVFEVEIQILDALYGIGSGKSKKEAEQKAAQITLERLKKEKPASQAD
jgi:ribonuclease-3